ncbi:MAG: hypothetical protein RL318_726, partial [Fibrobacterota bacterium]
NQDVLLTLPGMSQWMEELGDGFSEAVLKLGSAGRAKASEAIGYWGAHERHAHLLVRLAVDAGKTVRSEAVPHLPKIPVEVREACLEGILGAGSTAEKEQAAALLARFPTNRSREILRQALDTKLLDKVRHAVESALETLDAVGKSSASEFPPSPEWTPIPKVALGAEIREILRNNHQLLLADLEKAAAQEKLSNEENKTKYTWRASHFEQMRKASLDRILAYLESDEVATEKTKVPNEAIEIVSRDKSVAARPDFGVHRILRLFALRPHLLQSFWHQDLFQTWLKTQDPKTLDLRALAKCLEECGQSDSLIQQACLGSWWQGGNSPQEMLAPERVWPFFVENPQHLDVVFGLDVSKVDRYGSAPERIEKGLEILAIFPTIPARLIPPILELALGSGKTHRRHAQDTLSRLPDILDKICQSVDHSSQEIRVSAIRWLTRIAPPNALAILEKRLTKETREAVRATLLSCIEMLGGDLSKALSPETLLQEAHKGLKGGVPKAMEDFPLAGLPECRYLNGTPVEREVIQWWAVLAFKLKEPTANPLLVRYLTLLDEPSRSGLGLFILRSFVARDVRGPTLEEANAKATKEAPGRLQMYQGYVKYDWGKQWANHTLEMCFEEIRKESLATYLGSAIAEKGTLALCVFTPGARAVELVQGYMKEHYTRRSQIEAMLEALSVGADPLVIQLILSLARRYRTASVQEKARNLAEAIAERKQWSTDELADRTIPSAGLDEKGVLELDYGPRQFRVRLDADWKPVVETSEGKSLKALPDPNQSDDEALAKEAKSLFQGLKKGLKQILDLQTGRLYEAVCSQRTWAYADWREFLQSHPVVGRLVQALVWCDEAGNAFRPCEDRTLVNVEDDAVVLKDEARIRIAHGSLFDEATRKAWKAHFKDYKVKPLFPQMDRILPEFVGTDREITTRQGWVSDTFTLRGLFTKRGYQRSEAEDGGFFTMYRKDFVSVKIRAVIEFSGNCLPEENVAAALKTLSFERREKHRNETLELKDVPPVLLAEVYGDYLDIAAACRGFDPAWEKVCPW